MIEPLRIGKYRFRAPQSVEEFQQLFRLNYRIFVQELRQHPDDGSGLLIDRFHDKNRYVIAVLDGAVVGMISVHDQPPFSIEQKLADSARLEQLAGRLLEVRLLAIEKPHRNQTVFAGLLGLVYEYALAQGYDWLLISGLVERLDMYRKLGFLELGPAVRSGEALYAPMALRLSHLPAAVLEGIERWRKRTGRK